MNDAPADPPEPEPESAPIDTSSMEAMAQILEALRAGNKIQAIKEYRELTGQGLKESKEAIDALIEKYEIPMKSGCASLLLFALSSTLVLFWVCLF